MDDCLDGCLKLAAFVDSDPDFMIYPRSGILRIRLLLYHQDVLCHLERQLDLMDKHHASVDATGRLWCNLAQDDNQPRSTGKDLIRELEDNFETYGRSETRL